MTSGMFCLSMLVDMLLYGNGHYFVVVHLCCTWIMFENNCIDKEKNNRDVIVVIVYCIYFWPVLVDMFIWNDCYGSCFCHVVNDFLTDYRKPQYGQDTINYYFVEKVEQCCSPLEMY